jgi:hypothetical protein
MSKRASTASPPVALRRSPTTPVPPTPVLTSNPKPSRCDVTMPAVRSSSNPSSGLAWKSRRQVTIWDAREVGSHREGTGRRRGPGAWGRPARPATFFYVIHGSLTPWVRAAASASS